MFGYDIFSVIQILSSVVLTVIIVRLWRRFINGGVCTSQARLDGKTVLITGANAGIGKETARDLASRGARVILACRDIKKGETVASEIREEFPSAILIVRRLDLASLASVRTFAQKIYETEDRLDLLINNAGVAWVPEGRTEDGFEMHLGVNHLGHFLLTNLLLDILIKSGNSRIIIVSARSHKHGNIFFEDFNWEKSYSKYSAYNQSKVANNLFMTELHKRLQGTGVTVNCLHPGIVQTHIGKYVLFKSWNHLVFCWLYFLMFKTQWHGAQTTIHCAVSEELEGVSGLYFSDCKEKRMSDMCYDDQVAKKVWDISAQMVGLDENNNNGCPDNNNDENAQDAYKGTSEIEDEKCENDTDIAISNMVDSDTESDSDCESSFETENLDSDDDSINTNDKVFQLIENDSDNDSGVDLESLNSDESDDDLESNGAPYYTLHPEMHKDFPQVELFTQLNTSDTVTESSPEENCLNFQYEDSLRAQ